MAKAIEPIPVLRGKAAAWFEEFLRRGEKPSAKRLEQAKRDREVAARMRPLRPSDEQK
ncbi:MAG: hypothetical protein ACYC9X_01370 [Dehalococcoidia bacterium]